MKPRPYNLVLLSAEKADLNSYSNAKRTFALGAILDLAFDAIKTEGMYCGRQEDSYAVKLYAPISEDLAQLKRIAFDLFGQKTILVVGVDDKARLVFKDGREQALGHWTELSGHAVVDYVASGADFTRIGVRTFTVT